MTELEQFKAKVHERLLALQQTFARAAIGDFTQDIALYEEEDEFTETYTGVQIMLEVIRAQLNEMRSEVALRKELERRKDEFIMILGHELRNPLAPILYAAQLIKIKIEEEYSQDTDLLESAAIIERQSEHLSRLIKDLLDASRILHGKIEIRPAQLALSAVVANSIEAAHPSFVEKGHHITVEAAKEDVLVHADALRLEQIIVNLLNNAARYTPPGGSITVRISSDSQFGYVQVQDSGVGISSELLARIFDIFVQSRNSKAREGGLGLGLMIAKGLAQLHGGDLSATSEGEGKGSEFTVQVPLWQEVDKSHDTAPVLQHILPPAQLRRVLVVDDNSDLANTVAAMLRHFGHNVRIAYDGETAINIARAFEPQIVFLDLAIPDMDGFAILKQLKKERGSSAARFVALTGFGGTSDFEKTKAAGFDAHLVKPPVVDELLAVLM
jgi:signal transduction histidine kinase